jgi:glycosyltransferase involved in cell wall biosynthesis
MTKSGIARPGFRRVLLVDPMDQGHHVEYAAVLSKELSKRGVDIRAAGSSRFLHDLSRIGNISDGIETDYIQGSRLTGVPRKHEFLRKVAKIAHLNNAQAVHILFLDRFILPLALTRKDFRSARILATLHWHYFSQYTQQKLIYRPLRAIEKASLRQLLSCGVRVMVHSNIMRQRLAVEVGLEDIDYVPYPVDLGETSVTGRSEARRRLGVPPRAHILLAFGGTRLDKGADLAVCALRHLPESVHLLVAGRPIHFDARELSDIAKSLAVEERLHLHLRFIDDEEINTYFAAADLLLLPYRKAFSGQSGPLIRAAAMGIPIVCADNFVLAETVSEYNLGAIFPAEHAQQMVTSILTVLEAPPRPDTARFVADHSTSAFGDAVALSYSAALTSA